MPDAKKDTPWWVAASVEATRQTLDELAEDWPEEGVTRAEAQEFIRNAPVVPPRVLPPEEQHNHDAIGVYGNCPACGTVLPPGEPAS